MSDSKPTVVLVHGAFAESASWNPVIEQLHAHGLEAVAVANPLRSLTIDAAYVRDVIAGLDAPVVLVAHSYGGMVITEAAAENDAVVALVYVAAFAPAHGESAFTLSTQFPGSSLGDALARVPGLDGWQRPRDPARSVPPPVRRRHLRGAGSADGCDAATRDRHRPQRGAADGRTRVAGHPVMVRVR